MRKNTIEGFEAIQNMSKLVGGVDTWSETQKYDTTTGKFLYNDEHLICKDGRYIDSEYNCDKGVLIW